MLILANTTASTFCADTSELFSLLGVFITIFKIIIPILLIVFGMLDMGKAVTSGKDDEIKKQAMVFFKRVLAAVVVFFIPTIVGLVMTLINDASSSGNEAKSYCLCIKNITGIGSCN